MKKSVTVLICFIAMIAIPAALMGQGAYVVGDTQAGLLGLGTWKSATTVDVDGDGTEEIIAASWNSTTRNVYLLQQNGISLTATVIGTPGAEANRLYGGAAGDLDNDGNLDYVFGTRESTPNGLIYRLEYTGSGDIADPNNWELSKIDSMLNPGVQYDIIEVANIDGDDEDEVLYSGTPRGLGATDTPQPIAILNFNGIGFDRVAEIPAAADDVGGFGYVIAGMDFDNDGKKDIYAVNTDWHDVVGQDLVPRIYKYEDDGAGNWSVVWSTRLPLEFQNTWAPLAAADLDNDGKGELVWGPVNNFGGGLQPNPERIVVFETVGDGTDGMGIDNGDGTWSANAQWTITDQNDFNLRPFRWLIHDIDNDGAQEIVSALRVGDGINIYSVDDVPDNGGGTETWSLDYSGVTGTHYDLAIIDNTVYGIRDNGDVTPVTWDVNAAIEDDISNVVSDYSLEQNYPNPFNPTTSISYSIPTNDVVSLKIYNIMGQEVRTLVNASQAAGTHTIQWDGLNSNGQRVASGVYLYVMKAGKFVQSKKMTLMK